MQYYGDSGRIYAAEEKQWLVLGIMHTTDRRVDNI